MLNLFETRAFHATHDKNTKFKNPRVIVGIFSRASVSSMLKSSNYKKKRNSSNVPWESANSRRYSVSVHKVNSMLINVVFSSSSFGKLKPSSWPRWCLVEIYVDCFASNSFSLTFAPLSRKKNANRSDQNITVSSLSKVISRHNFQPIKQRAIINSS